MSNQNISADPIAALAQVLQEAGVEVRIGLRAQGHLPTVHRMLLAGATWMEIGRAIGWNGEAVRKWWRMEIEAANHDVDALMAGLPAAGEALAIDSASLVSDAQIQITGSSH